MNKLWFAIIGLSAFIVGHFIADIRCDRLTNEYMESVDKIMESLKAIENEKNNKVKNIPLETYKRWRAQEFGMEYLGGGRYRYGK